MKSSVASIPSLLGGISQQPPHLRSSDQLEAMTNGWASLAQGLQKRPPTESIAQIIATGVTDAHVHAINRDEVEQYIVVTTNGMIRVFDLAGNEKTVTAPGGWGYLSGVSSFADDIEMATVQDYTMVVNRKVICAMDVLGADTQADPGYLIWGSRQYDTDPNGNNYGPGSAYQYPPNPTGGVLTGSVPRYDKLPETAAQGAIYKIDGTQETSGVAYYVRRVGAAWEQTVLPGLVNAINPLTMPHALVRQADGTFVFAPFSWAPRRVGDTVTNPAPSFIGRAINKVFLYQSRLAFLHDESVTMSRVADFGNFFRIEQLDYLDDEVLSMSASTTGVATLADVTVHNDGMLLTSAQTQFSLSNGEAGVTAASVAIRPTTSYRVNTRAGLCPCGSEVYFATEGNGSAIIREYTRIAGSDTTSAGNITGHVPTLIPAGVHKIVAADDLDALFILTSGRPNSVFVYQFFWASSDTKVQTSWHEWTFDGAILSAAYLAGYLFAVVRRGGAVFLEKVDLQAGAHPAETVAQVFLDRRRAVTGVFDPINDRTTFTFPHAPDQATFRMVRGDAFTARPESLIDPSTYSWQSATTLRVPGNESLGAVVTGNRYEFAFELSQQFRRKQDQTAITSGRYQIRTVTINYRGAAYFKTMVTASGQTDSQEVVPARIKEFTGKTLGSSALILNAPSYDDGAYRMQVYSDAKTCRIRITNDSHVAATFISAEVEAAYWNVGAR